MSILSTYATHIEAIVIAITADTAASKVASDASKGRKSTTADALRAYATATADDGVDAEQAATALRAMMVASNLKAGTVNGYGASYRGFRAILAAGGDIAKSTVKEAQDYIASDETKALNAARTRITAAQAAFKKDLGFLLRLADAAEALKAEKEAAPADAPAVAEAIAA